MCVLFSEKIHPKRIQSKRRTFETFQYETKKQKTESDEDLFTPSVDEGSLTQELD